MIEKLFFDKLLNWPVWPAVEIKRSPNFYKSYTKSSHSSFYLKSCFGKLHKDTSELFWPGFSKVAQSGYTETHHPSGYCFFWKNRPLFPYFRLFKCKYVHYIILLMSGFEAWYWKPVLWQLWLLFMIFLSRSRLPTLSRIRCHKQILEKLPLKWNTVIECFKPSD